MSSHRRNQDDTLSTIVSQSIKQISKSKLKLIARVRDVESLNIARVRVVENFNEINNEFNIELNVDVEKKKHLLFVSHIRKKIFCQIFEFETQSMSSQMQTFMTITSRVNEQLRRIRLNNLVRSLSLIDFVANKL